MIDLDDYFKYHPPITQKRKDSHNAVDIISLEACKTLLENSTPVINDTCSELTKALILLVDDPACQRWIRFSVNSLKAAALRADYEAIVMHTQQARMFTNQGITTDEIKSVRDAKISSESSHEENV